MKSVIIADIHQQWQTAEEILKKETPYDEAIFLGDYYDAWKDVSPKDAFYTATWLRDSLNNSKHVHLWGNHDLPYRYPHNPLANCPGFTKEKLKEIQKVMRHEDWNKLKFFYIRGGWLLSHAGLSALFLPRVWKSEDITIKNVKDFLINESSHALGALDYLYAHWIYSHRHGLLWSRPEDRFKPIEGIAQIFGHTFHELPILFKGSTGLDKISNTKVLDTPWSPKDNWNVDLDCANKFYGVINDSILTIKSK